jgi:mono/diheme cytochrome c family protein
MRARGERRLRKWDGRGDSKRSLQSMMMNFTRPRFWLLVLLVFSGQEVQSAQDGKQLYTLYCSACHGAEGNGAAGAPFPPLAKSDWVKGDGRRMISVILHGLAEPIVVNQKSYNLQMPPQGIQLDDARIASIGTFVRQSFGNKESEIDEDLVSSVRKETRERSTPWTGPELLMKYPLPPIPRHKLGVRNLIAVVYEGEFETMPDFSKLQAISEEKEEGPISLRHAGGRTENFALVWEGTIDCPGTWDGNFFVSSVGGMRFFYNEQLVFELKGQGEHYRHTTARTGGTIKGENTFRLEYFQKGPNGGISLYRSGGSMGYHPLTDTFRDPRAASHPDIFIEPENGKAAIYRNTLTGVSPRAISVGLQGGVNYSFSASTIALELLWKGKFINAGQHWTHRGSGATQPAGESVVSLGKGPGIAKLKDPKIWPSKFDDGWKVRFKGYDLEWGNRPIFRYLIEGISLEDTLTGNPGGSHSLSREISLTIPEGKASNALALRLASDQMLSKNEEGYLVNETLLIHSKHRGRMKQHGGLLYFDLDGLKSGTHQFQIKYQWVK